MDPTNLYHLGQIQHQERLQAAEERRLAELLRGEPTFWRRLIARLTPAPTKEPMRCPDVLAGAQ